MYSGNVELQGFQWEGLSKERTPLLQWNKNS